MSKKIVFLFFIGLFGAFINVAAQSSQAVKPSLVKGEVISITAANIALKTDNGEVDVILNDKSEFKRVPPENPVLKAAVAATQSDIGVGDKLVVTGIFSADKKTLPARAVYLMTKSDFARKGQNETQKWQTRGISGKVTAVNPAANNITVEVRGLANTTTVTVTAKPDAKFKRYAPNSVKYSEATASSIADLRPGDMMRALGEKSADGTAFTAEEIVSGAFQTIAGTVKSVDAAKNEVVITNAQTKKDVTIDLGSATLLKRFPEEMAMRLAQFQGGAGARNGAGGEARPAPTGDVTPGAGQRGQGRGGFGGGRAGSIDEMLERFPDITAANLKVGDVIAVSSSKNTNLDRVTAIKLLAGVEPFLRAAQASAAGGQRGRGGQDGGFTIPGLDGFGGP